MLNIDVLALLIYCNELDGRHSPNEAKVLAWGEVFESSAPGMTLSFAKAVAKSHYGKYDVMIAPSTFVTKWRQHQDLQASANATTERHCGKSSCVCTHSEPCYKGWMDHPENLWTQPCPVCRADLAQVLSKINPLGSRSQSDQASIRLRHRSEVKYGAEA
jgi:hypothetical protein